MEDLLGSELSEGNVVIMNIPGYAGLRVGRIIKITEKKVRVKYGSSKYGEILKKPENVCKIDGPDATAFMLRKGL